MIAWDRVEELRCDLGDEGFAEVVALFLEETEAALKRFKGRSAPEAERELHFLRGSALNVGFSWLSRLCDEREPKGRRDARLLDAELLCRAYAESRDALLAGLHD